MGRRADARRPLPRRLESRVRAECHLLARGRPARVPWSPPRTQRGAFHPPPSGHRGTGGLVPLQVRWSPRGV